MTEVHNSAAKVREYLAERRKLWGIDHESIHGLHSGTERQTELLASDLDVLLTATEQSLGGDLCLHCGKGPQAYVHGPFDDSHHDFTPQPAPVTGVEDVVERVARAICRERIGHRSSDEQAQYLVDSMWEGCVPEARTAIAALSTTAPDAQLPEAWIDMFLTRASAEWSYHVDSMYPPRDFWHVRHNLGVLSTDWISWGKQEQHSLSEQEKAEGEAASLDYLRRSLLDVLAPGLSEAPVEQHISSTNEGWKKYKGDFNAMSDAQIEEESQQQQRQVDDAEDWLEAVASWKAAGKPRTQRPA